MAISNLSTGLRPGVCTSTTRPGTPFEGQMIYETDTNRVLVYEGAAWVMIADTDSPPGLVLIKAASFTSATSVSFDNNTFTSDFRNYKVFIDFTSSSANLTITCKMRASGSDTIASNYYQNAWYYSAGNTQSNIVVAAGSAWTLGYIATGNDFGLKAQWSLDVISPQVATTTRLVGPGGCSASAFNSDLHGTFAGQYNLSTQFDAMSFIASGGNNFTGVYRVYGYRDAI